MKTKTCRNLIHSSLLGLAVSSSLSSPAQTTVTQIAAGTSHSLFVKSDGSLWGMGGSSYGQLGDGAVNAYTYQPELIVTNGVTSVFARGNHSFFLAGGSVLWAMGDNQYGELGDGTTNNILFPKLIAGGFAPAAGYKHTQFLKNFGVSRRLYVMGDNTYGELGDGTYTNSTSPKYILSESTIQFNVTYTTAVAAGGSHSLFLKSDGSLWAMGAGDAVGDYPTNRPEKIVVSGVTAIAAGYYHSLFIKSDGSLWTMGDNNFGQLGNTNFGGQRNGGSSGLPTMVVPSGVTAIAGGYVHSLFIKTNGSLWGMGELSGFGGNYGLTNRPTQIVAAGVTAIASGDYYILFLLSDGSLWTGTPSRLVQIIGPMVANGGFESGDFTGWTRQGNQLNPVLPSPHTGAFAAGMGGSLGYLSQTLTTVPGTHYLLSFWINSYLPGMSEFIVSWNGVTLLDTNNPETSGWVKMQYAVTATGTNTLLQFGFRNDDDLIYFDDVSVVPMIAPAIAGIRSTGSNLVLNAANGQWNGTYVTLMGTNLMQPASQWTPVATNILDGSGNFSVTNTTPAMPADGRRFYTLRLQ